MITQKMVEDRINQINIDFGLSLKLTETKYSTQNNLTFFKVLLNYSDIESEDESLISSNLNDVYFYLCGFSMGLTRDK